MRIGSVVLWMVLFILLGMSLLFAYSGLGEMPRTGWIALICGIGFSLVVGIGLMALLFYSSRQGYDEPPKFEDNRERTSRGEARAESIHPMPLEAPHAYANYAVRTITSGLSSAPFYVKRSTRARGANVGPQLERINRL